MSRGVWQRTIVDDAGNVLAGTSVSVRDQSGVLVALYNAASGGSALSNPFNADAEGFARFYTDSTLVDITVTSNGDTRSWLQVVIAGTAAVADIVGTVSQSAGVPTGAIIESGSNANGSYVKYADGTMFCWGVYLGSITMGLLASPIYYGEAVLTFPALFVSAPTTIAFSGNNQAGQGWGGKSSNSNTVSTGYFNYYATSSSVTATDIQWAVIGRWF